MKQSEGRAFPSREVLGRFRGGLRAGSHNLSVVWQLTCLSPSWPLLSQAAIFLFSVHAPSTGPLLAHADGGGT